MAAPCCWAGWRRSVTSPACFLILGCAVQSAGHQLVPTWACCYRCCSCAAASCFCAAVARLWRCVSPRLLRCYRPAHQLILALLPLAESDSPLRAQRRRALRSSAASATSHPSRQLWRRCRCTRPPVRARAARDGMLHVWLCLFGLHCWWVCMLCCCALPAHECWLAPLATTLQASCRTPSTSHPSQPTPRPRRAARSARYRAPQVRQLFEPPADAWFTERCCRSELDAALSRWLAAAALHFCRGRGAGGCSAGQRAHCACCQGGASCGSGG